MSLVSKSGGYWRLSVAADTPSNCIPVGEGRGKEDGLGTVCGFYGVGHETKWSMPVTQSRVAVAVITVTFCQQLSVRHQETSRYMDDGGHWWLPPVVASIANRQLERSRI